MKTARILAAVLVSASGLLLSAQSTPPPTSAPASPASNPEIQSPIQQAPNATQPNATQNSSPAAPADLKPVKAELMSKLDSKNAKPGDSVVVKTQENVTTADGTEIPKGSKLLGHVALVQAHSKEVENSRLTLLFDQAQMKNGQDLPIHSVIESVAPPFDSMAGNGMQDMPAGPTPGAGGAMSSGRTSGGSPTAPMPAPATGAAAPITTTGSDSAASAPGNTSIAGKVVAGSGANAIRTTDIPNIYLASNAADASSGTLFSAKSNVHLDSGTRIVLGVAAGGAH